MPWWGWLILWVVVSALIAIAAARAFGRADTLDWRRRGRFDRRRKPRDE